jgi:hypothetical protein
VSGLRDYVRELLDGRGPLPPVDLARRHALLVPPMRPGQRDALAVLVLRLLRRSWLTLMGLGFIWVIHVGRFSAAIVVDLNTPGKLVSALLTPLAGIAIAIGVRILAGFSSSLAALPLALDELSRRPAQRRRQPSDATDLYYLATALGRVRATRPVRDEAAARWGRLGTLAVLVDRVLGFTGPAACAAAVVVLVLGW